jgi:hypothetical protein
VGEHVKSKHDKKYGDYMIHIGGAVVDDEGTVEDSDVFTYDVNKDEQGADVIVNFGRLDDKKAKAAQAASE